MKKSLITLSLVSALIGCGGSNGSSSAPVTPPVSDTTIHDIANAWNVEYSVVESVCADTKNFACSVTSKGLETVRSHNGLVHASSSEKFDEFKNFGAVEFRLTKNVKLSDINKVSFFFSVWDNETSTYLTKTIDNESSEYVLNEQTGMLSISLPVDVRKFNMVDSMDSILNAELPEILATAEIFLKDGSVHTVDFMQGIASSSYKAMLNILVQKNQELFEGELEPENRVPEWDTYMDQVGETLRGMKAGTTLNLQLHATDPDGDKVEYLLGADLGFISVNSDTGEYRFSPKVEHVGDHVFAVGLSDSELSTIMHIPFTVTMDAIDLEPSEPSEPTLQDFANLIGEPVDKLELLFEDASGITWKVAENGNPLIEVSNIGGQLTFDLFANTLNSRNFTHINGTYATDVYEVEEIRILHDTFTDFETIDLELHFEPSHGFTAESKFDYDANRLKDLIESGDVWSSVRGIEHVSGSHIQLGSRNSAMFFVPDSYIDLLHNVIAKHLN